MQQEHDKLNQDYINNVLPFLFKEASSKIVTDYGSGRFQDTYELELDFKSLLACDPSYNPNGKSFVHFTSLKALHSILNEGAIRMYNLMGMNDPLEFEYIASEFGYNIGQLKMAKEHAYACAFCPSDILAANDSLLLWRLYGLNGYGCAIEFEIEDPDTTLSSIKLGKVNYNKPNYDKFFKANQEFEARHKIKVNTKVLIRLSALLHKNPIFFHEQEVRLFIEEDFEIPERSLVENSQIRYDFNSRNEVISYRLVDLYQNKLGVPNIKINRIQLGFQISDIQAKLIDKHIHQIFWSITRKKIESQIPFPEVDVSPLRGMFR